MRGVSSESGRESAPKLDSLYAKLQFGADKSIVVGIAGNDLLLYRTASIDDAPEIYNMTKGEPNAKGEPFTKLNLESPELLAPVEGNDGTKYRFQLVEVLNGGDDNPSDRLSVSVEVDDSWVQYSDTALCSLDEMKTAQFDGEMEIVGMQLFFERHPQLQFSISGKSSSILGAFVGSFDKETEMWVAVNSEESDFGKNTFPSVTVEFPTTGDKTIVKTFELDEVC